MNDDDQMTITMSINIIFYLVSAVKLEVETCRDGGNMA